MFDAAVFEDAGPVGGPDRFVVTLFDHDVVDTGFRKQVRQHQPGGATADDSDPGLDDVGIRHDSLHLIGEFGRRSAADSHVYSSAYLPADRSQPSCRSSAGLLIPHPY